MSFFKFKKKKKEDQPTMTTLEEVRKAYEDLSDDDKEKFHQSIADRVHESVAAQEHDEGETDSQSAEAREHEALGAEHSDGKDETEELGESDDTPEEKVEDVRDEGEDKFAALAARLDALEQRLDEKEKTGEVADEQAAQRAAKVYGVGNGVFAAAHRDEQAITPQEAAEIARKQKF